MAVKNRMLLNFQLDIFTNLLVLFLKFLFCSSPKEICLSLKIDYPLVDKFQSKFIFKFQTRIINKYTCAQFLPQNSCFLSWKNSSQESQEKRSRSSEIDLGGGGKGRGGSKKSETREERKVPQTVSRMPERRTGLYNSRPTFAAFSKPNENFYSFSRREDSERSCVACGLREKSFACRRKCVLLILSVCSDGSVKKEEEKIPVTKRNFICERKILTNMEECWRGRCLF
ncbi:hypothetical protein JTE90_009462 [Oedothorax gibbosus]|uniref:Uncharacterized protein n=1 Tax=Oedothorax gibbosus TaxID=931172 RepID=A0AAV6VSG3_9ARAC|nr:hypothetical protein JTE90_009462 [Oedothorax gibbosus]